MPNLPETLPDIDQTLPRYESWMDKAIDPENAVSYRFFLDESPELVAALRSELEDGGGWTPQGEVPRFPKLSVVVKGTGGNPDTTTLALDHRLIESVGMGKVACPMCNWTREYPTDRRIVYVPYQGLRTGFRVIRPQQCVCLVARFFHHYWSGSKALAPPAYQWVRFDDLQPSSVPLVSMAKQAQRIAFLRKHPDWSYLFAGQSNCGKTIYAMALLQNALMGWAWDSFDQGSPVPFNIYRVTAEDWLKQYNKYETRPMRSGDDGPGNRETDEYDEPSLNAKRMRRLAALGHRPRVFIDELDKVSKLTEFKAATLFRTLDAVMECKGQLVGTSNQNMAQLESRFGTELVRRFFPNIDGEPAGRLIEFKEKQ